MKANILGKNIKKIRTEKNIFQKTLAEKLGITRQTLSYWELGICEPDVDTIIKLAKYFNVSLDDFLTIEL